MKINVYIDHPGHVHLFKYFIQEMEQKGHEILITAREKEVTFKLLKSYGFKFVNLGDASGTILHKVLRIPLTDIKHLMAVKKFKPDFIIGLGAISVAHIANLVGAISLIIDDDEMSNAFLFYYPFANHIITPIGLLRNYRKKQIRVNSYKELAYLYTNRFIPKDDFYKYLGISKNDKYILFRFNSFSAHHDVGAQGLSNSEKKYLIKEIEKERNVFISSESKLPKELQKYQLKIPPNYFHDIIYNADIFIADTGTSITEACCLGTPSIVIYRWNYTSGISNFIELEKKYGLLFNVKECDHVLQIVRDLLQKKDLKEIWKQKLQKLMSEKIDLTSFLIQLMEKYPK